MQTEKWFDDLISSINTLAESFDLDEEQTALLRERVLGIAKREYMQGNKAGIAWALKKKSDTI